jgi:membrane-associated phospholipid phosphatase
MLSIIAKNKNYFALYFLFFIVLFIYQISFYQTDALFFFSNHRSPFSNTLFLFITRMGEELAFLLLTLWFVYKKDRKTALKIGATGLSVLIISIILKYIFSHPRPITFFEEQGIMDKFNLVNGYTLRGTNSFPSGHTMASFALYSVIALHFSHKKMLKTACLTVAILVGVSRVYLGAHFPEDVLLGSAMGIFIAIGIEYYFSEKIFPKPKNTTQIDIALDEEIIDDRPTLT